MIAIIIIILLALYIIYKLVVAVDNKLSKDRRNGIVIREPESDEEKENVSTALRLYGQDSDLPILICRHSSESEEKHDKTLILFFLGVVLVVVIAIGLILAI